MPLVFIFCLEGIRGCAAHLPMMFPAREKHDSLDALVAGPRARRRSWGKTVVSALIRNFRNGRRGRRTTTSRVHWSRSGEKHGQHSENGWSLKFKSKKNKPAKRVRTTSDLSLLKIKRSRKKCSPPREVFFTVPPKKIRPWKKHGWCRRQQDCGSIFFWVLPIFGTQKKLLQSPKFCQYEVIRWIWLQSLALGAKIGIFRFGVSAASCWQVVALCVSKILKR